MVGSFATETILTKNSLMENLGQDYVRTAFAKGLTERRVIFVHALRNSLIPLVTGLGHVISLVLAGSFLIERVFNIDGMGYLGYTAILQRDYPVALGILVISSLLMLVGNILSDIIYARGRSAHPLQMSDPVGRSSACRRRGISRTAADPPPIRGVCRRTSRLTSLTSPSRRVAVSATVRKFRRLKRGYYSFLIITVAYVVSFFLPLLANNIRAGREVPRAVLLSARHATTRPPSSARTPSASPTIGR